MSAIATASRRGGTRRLWRYTLLLHRWLGIGVGIVVLLWCLSGIVMMYVQYPALELDEQLAGLQPLDGSDCCHLPPNAPIASAPAAPYVLERLSGQAVLRMAANVFDVGDRRAIDGWPENTLYQVGMNYADRRGWKRPYNAVRVERDQWTVHARFDVHRPLLKFADADGRHWYVSDTTAEIVQVTDRAERFWNWLGAVPHWLYPTVLRQHTALWAQVVIWLTIVSLFLTVTGLVIGVKQYRWRTQGRRSPYRGWWRWHHYAGVVFGLFTLAWVFSGLLSMNPWGLLESRSFAAERQLLNGVGGTLAEATESLDSIMRYVPADSVRIESAYWLGTPYWLARNARGDVTRIDTDGPVAGIDAQAARKAAAALGLPEARIDRIQTEDAYYYGLHSDVTLPAWRLIAANGDRLYIGETSGRFVAGYDAHGRRLRWLFEGLHRGDFNTLLRTRPLWDVLMLLLLTGVTIGAGSGVWIGLRRLQGRTAGSGRPPDGRNGKRP